MNYFALINAANMSSVFLPHHPSVPACRRTHDFAGGRVQDELAICSELEWSIALPLGGNMKRLILLDDGCLNILWEASKGRICRL